MSYSEPARTAARRTRSTTLTALAAISAALLGVLVAQSLVESSFSTASPIELLHGDPSLSVPSGESDLPAPEDRPLQDVLDRHNHRRPAMALGEEDGAVPDGVTVFDDGIPAVANLDPALRGALRQATTDAAGDGVQIFVDSGWRSPEYQEQLLREAISKYGSEKEAARWVATPNTSAHVSGDAVDLGPVDATAWLSKHGAKYGLCQIYRNEPWHYELRPKASAQGCPPKYTDPTHDPRMQQ
jgi:D-alanyl-D-alanine carboxypeptidase